MCSSGSRTRWSPHAAHGDGVEEPLEAAEERVRASDMLEQKQPTTGTQDARGLGHGSSVVGDGAQDHAEHDRVEMLVGVGERGRVSLQE
jgi:hypothetical protein